MLTRAVRLFAVGLLLAVPLVLTGGTAQAAACSGTTGVTVIVQFPGGRTETGCAAGNPNSGLAALAGAGFEYAFAPREPGFVCTIDGEPGNGDCMKPDYWSYWHAKRGGSWSYSSLGAGNYDPAPGTVEGWRFGGGNAPTTPPPAKVSAPKPKPKPTPTPTRSATPTASTSTSASPTTSVSASASASPSASSSASTLPTPTDSGSSAPAAAADASPVSAPASGGSDAAGGSGGTLPWGWGVGVLALLLATGGALALLRRRGTS